MVGDRSIVSPFFIRTRLGVVLVWYPSLLNVPTRSVKSGAREIIALPMFEGR